MKISTTPVTIAAKEFNSIPAIVPCSWRMASASTDTPRAATTNQSGRSERTITSFCSGTLREMTPRLPVIRHFGLCGGDFADRRQRRHHAFGGEGDEHFRAFAQFRAQREAAAVQVDQPLHDREPKPRALLGAFQGVRTLAEGGKDDGNFLFRNAGPRIAHG